MGKDNKNKLKTTLAKIGLGVTLATGLTACEEAVEEPTPIVENIDAEILANSELYEQYLSDAYTVDNIFRELNHNDTKTVIVFDKESNTFVGHRFHLNESAEVIDYDMIEGDYILTKENTAELHFTTDATLVGETPMTLQIKIEQSLLQGELNVVGVQYRTQNELTALSAEEAQSLIEQYSNNTTTDEELGL